MRFTKPLRIFLVVAMAAAAQEQADHKGAANMSSEWFQLRGPNRDGISLETGWTWEWPPEGPPVLWSANVGRGYSCFSVRDGRAYTMGRLEETVEGIARIHDWIICLDAAHGDEIWKHTFTPTGKYVQPGDNGPASTPTVIDGKVWALGLNGEFFCLEAATGQVQWSKNLMEEYGVKPSNYGFTCSPLIEGEKVILDVGRTIAFEKHTGHVIWKTEDYTASYCSPQALDFNNERCVLVFNGSGLFVLKMSDGTELWRQDWSIAGINNVNAAMPVLNGNKVFITSTYEAGWGLVGLDLPWKPPIIWKAQHEWHLLSSPVLHEGHIYEVEATKLTCLEMETGKIKWRVDDFGNGTLILSNRKLIILCETGELVIAEASPESYTELARAQILGKTCWTVPALSGGCLYVRNSKGEATCVDLQPGS